MSLSKDEFIHKGISSVTDQPKIFYILSTTYRTNKIYLTNR